MDPPPDKSRPTFTAQFTTSNPEPTRARVGDTVTALVLTSTALAGAPTVSLCGHSRTATVVNATAHRAAWTLVGTDSPEGPVAVTVVSGADHPDPDRE